MPNKNEVLKDYMMLDKMSKDLKSADKRIIALGKKVAAKKNVDMMSGLTEVLESVSEHIASAYSEVEKAKKKLKMI